MDLIFRLAEEFLKKHKRLARYRRVFALLAAVVVFATTYELILPAITMDKKRALAEPGVEVGVASDRLGGLEASDDLFGESTVSEEALGAEFPAEADAALWDPAGEGTGDAAPGSPSSGTWTEESAANGTGGSTSGGNAFDENASGGDAFDSGSGDPTDSAATDPFGGTAAGGTSFDGQSSGGNAIEDGQQSGGVSLTDGQQSGGDTFSDGQQPGTGTDEAASATGSGVFAEGENTENTGITEGSGTDTSDSDSAAGSSAAASGTAAGETFDADAAQTDLSGADGLEADPSAFDQIVTDPGETNGEYAGTGSADETAKIGGTDGSSAADPAAASGNDGTTNTASAGATGQTALGSTDASAIAATDDERTWPATLTYEGKDYTVTATFDEKAALPADVTLQAVEILPDTEYKDENGDPLYPGYEEYYEKTLAALEKEKRLADDQTVSTARFFDITFLDKEGTAVEPKAPVSIAVQYKDALPAAETADTMAVHFDVDEKKDKTEVQVIETKTEVETVRDTKTKEKKEEISQISFDAEKFSVYGVIGTQLITTDFLTADGKTLKVTVTFDKEEEVPKGAVLEVKEIQEKDEGWIDRSVRLADVLSEKYGNYYISEARFLDISILVDGKEYEPRKPVQIKVEYTEPFQAEYTVDSVDTDPEGQADFAKDKESPEFENHFAVVHYDDNNKAQILDAQVEKSGGRISGSTVMTAGFSDYDFVNLDSYETKGLSLVNTSSMAGTISVNQAAKALAKASTLQTRDNVSTFVPDHEKTLINNGNGTYTIGLNVTGDAETTSEASDVNVVIVYDVSSSMTIYHTPSSTGRYGKPASTYSTDYPRLYYRNGNNYQYLNNDTYTGNVYTRSGNNYNRYTGTRYSALWRADAAEKTLYDFTHSLFSYQNASKDNIRAALVTFDASARTLVNWTTSETAITGILNGTGTGHSDIYGSGTNWEAAMKRAQTVVDSAGNDDPTYVIFITDGAPTQSSRYTTKTTDSEGCYEDAQDDARALYTSVTNSGGEFFGIYAYGEEADWLATMMYYAYNGREPAASIRGETFDTDGYYNASNTEDLTRAIGEIFQKIVQTLGISGVSIQDGTTSHVETSTGTAHLLVVENSYQYWLSMPVVPGTGGTYTFTMPDKVSGEDITYTVTPDGDNVTITWEGGGVTCPGTVNLNTLTIEWTQANSFYNYAPPAASYSSETGAVNWNLRGLGTLLDGVTYTVTFDCYPSQETLDLIADLKNEYIEYDDLDPEIQKYLKPSGNDYILATNTEATLTYTDTRTDQGEQNKTYDNPDPVPAPATEEVAITKDWSNLVDDRGKPDSLTMHVTRDGVDRYEMILNDGDSWTNSAWISFGILTEDADGSNISIKTTGHDYSFSEPADMTYYWELVIPTLRPMLINANPTILEKIESSDAPEMEGDNAKATVDGITYYKLTIGGTTEYFKVDPYAPKLELKAENHRRSQLDVSKTVSGGNVPEDAEFTFKASVVNSHASSGSEEDHNSDYYVWFSIFSEEGLVIDEEDGDLVSGTGLVRERNSSDEYTGYYYIPSGNLITVKMKDGYNLRFLNLPTGTSYLISESNEMPDDSYSFDGISGIRKYTETVVNPETGEETTVEKTEEAGEVDGQAISGTVDKTNSTYKVNVTNKYETTDVQLKKVREDGSTPLDGAVFDLTVWLDGAWSSVQEDISPGSVNSPDGDQTQEEDASSGNSDSNGNDESAAGESGNPFDLGGLGAGWYRLTEEHTPSGYIIKNKDIYFEIYKDNEEFLIRLTDKDQHVIQTLEGVTITKSTGQDGTVTWMITVVNTPGERLPMTGGSGKPPYILSGILLAMASALIYVFRMRQRERRSY